MKPVAVAAAILLALAAGCGGNGGGDETAAATDTEATQTAADGCREVEAPAPREPASAEQPTERLDPDRTHRLLFATSCGPFTVELDPIASPEATASLVALAEAGWFDGTTFHRVVPDFVVQGGDPTGTGAGGPGYATEDAPASGTTYTAGTVAMAKTQAEPPGTAGSQFFIVTAEDAGLPPDYAVVGRVVEGMETVRRIEELGDAQTQMPQRPIVLESVTVQSSE